MSACGEGGTEGCADWEGAFVEGREFANVRDADEEDDGDGGGVLGQAKADVAVEEGTPGLCGAEEEGKEESSNSTDDGI